MLCSKPFRKDGDEYGCGRCLPCLTNRRNLWTIRLMLEAQLHDKSMWATLTYDNEHLPQNGTLVVKHCQDFLKRLRYFIHPDRVRYYLAGEYGDKFGRPHYHVCLFGINCPEHVRKAWYFGSVDCGDVTFKSAAYTVSYITKGHLGVSIEGEYARIPEFARMSLNPGIGAGAASTVHSAYVSYDTVLPTSLRVDGRVWPLGRYLSGLIRELDTGSRKESVTDRDRRRREFLAKFPSFDSRVVRDQKRSNQADLVKSRLQISKSKKEF